MSPVFSLVLCTLGDRPALDRFLASLTGSSCQDYELIVVIQAQDDVVAALSAKLAAWPGLRAVTVLTSPRGLSRARNVGLAAARGHLVAFPDDDCWYPPQTLGRMAAAFDGDPGLSFLSGRMVDANGRSASTVYAKSRGEMRKASIFRQGISSAMAVRRSGPCAELRFDETLGLGAGTPFGSGEETDFLLRGLELGGRGLFDPAIEVGHDQDHAPLTPSYLERRRSYARGYGKVLRRHRFSRVFVAANFTKTACGSAYFLLRGDVATARSKLAWVSGAIEGYFTHQRDAAIPAPAPGATA